MAFALIIILMATAALPVVWRKVEDNIEVFLLIMGITASAVTGQLTGATLLNIVRNQHIYLITAVVFAVSLLFYYFERHIERFVVKLSSKLPLRLFLAVLIVVLGLISGIITAIVAALLLAHILSLLCLDRKTMVRVNILACFSIGAGAALTAFGEPLSTIAVSRMNAGYDYLFKLLGVYFLPLVLLLSVATYFLVGNVHNFAGATGATTVIQKEKLRDVFVRTGKVFLFVVALEIFGAGFRPVFDKIMPLLSSKALYWANSVSAIVDNATLASAELSPVLSESQVRAVLMGLVISGGMLITGNIPNIITASKLGIGSKEWAKFGVPLGAALMLLFFVILLFVGM